MSEKIGMPYPEGKDITPHAKSTENLHSAIAGHHAGSEAHIAGLKEHGHELASATDRHLNTKEEEKSESSSERKMEKKMGEKKAESMGY